MYAANRHHRHRRHCRGGALPAITGEDGRRTIELICAIFQSGPEGRTKQLPLKPDDPFYTVQGILAHAPYFYEKTISAASLVGDITLGGTHKTKGAIAT